MPAHGPIGPTYSSKSSSLRISSSASSSVGYPPLSERNKDLSVTAQAGDGWAYGRWRSAMCFPRVVKGLCQGHVVLQMNSYSVAMPGSASTGLSTTGPTRQVSTFLETSDTYLANSVPTLHLHPHHLRHSHRRHSESRCSIPEGPRVWRAWRLARPDTRRGAISNPSLRSLPPFFSLSL